MPGPFRLSRLAIAFTVIGSFALVGCSAAQQATNSPAGGAAKQLAIAAGQAALAPALNPLLEMLARGQADLQAGQLGAAVTVMGGFQSLWDKTSPVIQPLAGEKWAAIDSAAKTVISTFGSGAKPDAATAAAAISGLLGPLQALSGK